MTTLDDAAERHREILAAYDKWRGNLPYSPVDHTMFGAGWITATEAAAKKCEARAEAYGTDYTNHDLRKEAEECAAAIRGKGS